MGSFYIQYPASAAGTNPSVSTNGLPIPSESTLVAGENPTGNQQPLQTDALGNLLVNINADSLTPINTKDAADGTTGAAVPAIAIQTAGTDGTNLRALSVDTTGKLNINNISGTVSLPTGAATSAIQTNGTQVSQVTQSTAANLNATVVQGTAANLNATVVGTTAAGSGSATNLVTVQGNAAGTAIPVTGTVAVTGVATSANQTNGTQKTQIVDGSGNVIASTSNQLNTVVTDTTTTGNITSNQSVTAVCNSRSSVGIAIQGTWTGSVVLEGSVDGSNFASVSAIPLSGGTIASTFTANATVQANISGLISIRIRGNTVATGTANITIQANATAGAVVLSEALPNGGNTIGSINNISGTISLPTLAATSTKQSDGTQTTQINNGATTVAVKAASTAALAADPALVVALSPNNNTLANALITKVSDGTNTAAVKAASTAAIATDTALVVAISPNNSITTSTAGTIIANAPVTNTYSSVNITTGAYVQLVASTSNTINNIHIFDSSGQAMILAIGGAGSEVNQLYVPPGGDTYNFHVPSGTRISYKALTATANSGYLLMSFLQ